MKVILLIAALTLASPAFAETAPSTPPSPSAPVNKDAKTDFTKPFVDDRLVAQRLPVKPPPPYVELKAGSEAK